jgi:hypothetical protein
VAYINNGTLFSYKNGWSFVIWRNAGEPGVSGEISQAEKEKCYMIVFLCRLYKANLIEVGSSMMVTRV